jgi:SagB-type dehydrogenase family enzyme
MAHIKAVGVAAGLIMVMAAAWSGAADVEDITLPAPRMTGGKPLMEALKERASSRAFSPKKLPPQVLSDLLWAAFGINRPGSGKRTAPSAVNWQEVEIYAVMEDGAYLYDARANLLQAVAKGDLRKLAGTQGFVARAPLNLVYVADTARMRGASAENQALYSAADTGFISQNVYLFCASEGLATVVRGSLDREALGKALELPPQKKIMLAQTVGYPEKEGQ